MDKDDASLNKINIQMKIRNHILRTKYYLFRNELSYYIYILYLYIY